MKKSELRQMIREEAIKLQEMDSKTLEKLLKSKKDNTLIFSDKKGNSELELVNNKINKSDIYPYKVIFNGKMMSSTKTFQPTGKEALRLIAKYGLILEK